MFIPENDGKLALFRIDPDLDLSTHNKLFEACYNCATSEPLHYLWRALVFAGVKNIGVCLPGYMTGGAVAYYQREES